MDSLGNPALIKVTEIEQRAVVLALLLSKTKDNPDISHLHLIRFFFAPDSVQIPYIPET